MSEIFWFIVALGILVTFHELGHFWVARYFGVKVLRFSVGFGKPIWRRTDRSGTEYVLAMIPLGGYVKMLNDDEEPLDPDDQSVPLSHKKLWQKSLIVLAGPAANFLLAAIFFTILALMGEPGIRPVISAVDPGSPAEQAGLVAGQQIVSVDGEPTESWSDVQEKLFLRVGHSGHIALAVKPFEQEVEPKEVRILINDWLKKDDGPDTLGALGFQVYPPITNIVVADIKDGPAKDAGIKVNDRIVAIDDHIISTWSDFVEKVRARPGQNVVLTIERSEEPMTLPVSIAEREGNGYVGILPFGVELPASYFFLKEYTVLESLLKGARDTWSRSVLIVVSIKKLVTTDLSIKNLSGPIAIAKVAGDSAERGLRYFLAFLAFLSVNLGIINLLPIPMLDGGHLLFYSLEAIKGKQISENVKATAVLMGLLFIVAIFVLASYFDVSKLL